MKILKIIVDKLPRTCAECSYLYFDGKFNDVPCCGCCGGFLKKLDNENGFDWKTQRPSWCLLEKDE